MKVVGLAVVIVVELLPVVEVATKLRVVLTVNRVEVVVEEDCDDVIGSGSGMTCVVLSSLRL